MTKVNVVFFASLRESLGHDGIQVEADLPMTVASLKQQLATQLSAGERLLEAGVQSSIDFEFSRDHDQIPITVKEVAFFPPVTGG